MRFENNVTTALDKSIITFQEITGQIKDFFPTLWYIILISVVGFIGGRIISQIIKKFLIIANIDEFSSQIELNRFLRILGYKGTVSDLISSLVRLFIYIFTLLAIIQILNFSLLIDLFRQIIAYIPRIIASIIVIIFGFLLSDYICRIIRGLLRETGIDNMSASRELSISGTVSRFIKYGLYIVSIITALNILGIGTATLNLAFSSLIIGMILIAVISTRDIAPNTMAGIYLHLSGILKKGLYCECNEISGRIHRVGPVHTVIKDGQTMVIIPNTYFIKNPVKLVKKHPQR